MASLAIELPESLWATSDLSRDQFVREARLLLAAKLFELGRVSSGRAAEFCGMSRVDFLLELGRLNVSAIQIDDEELGREFATL